MPLNELFLIAIGATLAINVAVVAAAAHRDGRPWSLPGLAGRWVARPAAGRSAAAIPIPWPEPDSHAVVDHGAGTAAAIEAFVSGVDRNAGAGEPMTGPRSAAQSWTAQSWRAPAAGSEQQAGTTMDDAATAIAVAAGSDTWNRELREETARVARFGRPATVVFAECPGLDGIAERLGAVASDRVAAELARLLVAEGRATDRVARLGVACFGVLLVETDELLARRYVDRVRAASDDWLASAGLAVRLMIGWASPDRGTDLAVAADTARERMASGDSRPAAVGPKTAGSHRAPASRRRPGSGGSLSR